MNTNPTPTDLLAASLSAARAQVLAACHQMQADRIREQIVDGETPFILTDDELLETKREMVEDAGGIAEYFETYPDSSLESAYAEWYAGTIRE